MDPVVDEISRVRSPPDIRSDVFRRWQAYLTGTVQPMLDELAAYKAGELPLLVGGQRRKDRV